MHRPPAASYKVTRSRGFAAALLLVWLLATLNLTLFAWLQRQAAIGALLGVFCVMVAVWAMRAWLRMPTGMLRWDGEHLYWQDREEPVQQWQILLDMNFLLIVRLSCALQQNHWIVLSQMAGQDWLAIRRVLVANGSSGAGSSGTGIE